MNDVVKCLRDFGQIDGDVLEYIAALERELKESKRQLATMRGA